MITNFKLLVQFFISVCGGGRDTVSVKHGGGSAIVLGNIFASAIGDLVKIDGIMKSDLDPPTM